MLVQTGDNVGIGGFIITGNTPKYVIVRGIGPTLTRYNIAGVLADPMLELHGPGDFGTMINNNWRDTQETEIQATGIPPTNDFEPAIVATLAPGSYTAIVKGKNGGTGIGLVDAYDLDVAADSTLGNLSTRGFVDTGDNAMIAGVTVGGGSSQILVRALGVELIPFGGTDPLQDTVLEFLDKSGGVITNHGDWEDTQEAGSEGDGPGP